MRNQLTGRKSKNTFLGEKVGFLDSLDGTEHKYQKFLDYQKKNFSLESFWVQKKKKIELLCLSTH